jgi:N-methylhydantoinase B
VVVVDDERDPYEGGRGRHRVLRLAPALAASLGVATGDLVEMLGRHPAPVRAWIRVDDAAPGERVALDALGRRILGVEPGDDVRIRRLLMPPLPGGLVER